MNKVIAIVGPTAVGKTALSIKLAHEFDGEVISGDSDAARYQELTALGRTLYSVRWEVKK